MIVLQTTKNLFLMFLVDSFKRKLIAFFQLSVRSEAFQNVVTVNLFLVEKFIKAKCGNLLKENSVQREKICVRENYKFL